MLDDARWVFEMAFVAAHEGAAIHHSYLVLIEYCTYCVYSTL